MATTIFQRRSDSHANGRACAWLGFAIALAWETPISCSCGSTRGCAPELPR